MRGRQLLEERERALVAVALRALEVILRRAALARGLELERHLEPGAHLRALASRQDRTRMRRRLRVLRARGAVADVVDVVPADGAHRTLEDAEGLVDRGLRLLVLRAFLEGGVADLDAELHLGAHVEVCIRLEDEPGLADGLLRAIRRAVCGEQGTVNVLSTLDGIAELLEPLDAGAVVAAIDHRDGFLHLLVRRGVGE